MLWFNPLPFRNAQKRILREPRTKFVCLCNSSQLFFKEKNADHAVQHGVFVSIGKFNGGNDCG